MVKQTTHRPAETGAEQLEHLAAEALHRCDALAHCSEERDRLTRTFCTAAMSDAHRLVGQWMNAAGMATHVDAAGNLVGTYHPPGCNPQRRVLLGSHLDTVVDAGRYDGMLGVTLAIAAIAHLSERQLPLPWALEAIGFSEEEGVRFGAPFIGSRALAGTLDSPLLNRADACGVTVAEALRGFGCDPAAVAQCRIEPSSVVAFIEPHIEQGPVLETFGEPLAVVSGIAGQTRLALEWKGAGGHAGTAPMAGRRDPLPAACRWAARVEQVGQETAGLVATVGRMQVEPNAPNCIPQRVAQSLDVRHAEDAVRRAAVDDLTKQAERLAREAAVELSVATLHEHAAIAMHDGLTDRLAAAVAATGAQPRRMVSGAGHDAGIMAAVVPTAMLFLRSPGGVSHHPSEAATRADASAALATLVALVEQLADVELP